MKKIWAIFKKETRGFLLNPNFLIVCALVATILSWVFPSNLKTFDMQIKSSAYSGALASQAMNIHYGVFLRHLSYVNLMLILVVPALTMRLFSEEKKMRTFDLLLTSPITSMQIVIGKYLSALVSVFAILFIAFLYPAATAIFAKLNWGTLIVAFCGIFLVASVYAAMDMFCSSLTESAIVSYVMAVIFNVSIWFVGVGVDIVDNPDVRSFFEHISLNQHLSAMVEGTVRTTGLVFFASLVFFFCFLAERVVEANRWR